jgi:hypothetical protein
VKPAADIITEMMEVAHPGTQSEVQAVTNLFAHWIDWDFTYDSIAHHHAEVLQADSLEQVASEILAGNAAMVSSRLSPAARL